MFVALCAVCIGTNLCLNEELLELFMGWKKFLQLPTRECTGPGDTRFPHARGTMSSATQEIEWWQWWTNWQLLFELRPSKYPIRLAWSAARAGTELYDCDGPYWAAYHTNHSSRRAWTPWHGPVANAKQRSKISFGATFNSPKPIHYCSSGSVGDSVIHNATDQLQVPNRIGYMY